MNSVTHFELPANNKEETKKFYADVIGWKYEDMGEMNYTMVYTSEVDDKYMPTTPGAVNGGMMSAEDNGGLNPVLVIDVADIDAAMEKIEAAGGTFVMPKTEVGDMGLYARFKDPSGVVMGVWQTLKGQ